MSNSPHILVFDSGAGGLSIAKTLLARSSKPLHLSYIADRSAFPYGGKLDTFLVKHVCSLVGDFIQQHKPDLIVIACNTASTIVLPELRRLYRTPFVGVVPAIKPAASQSISKSIGILATPATVTREYTSSLIQEFAPDCQVHLYGSEYLVHAAESFVQGEMLDKSAIKQELSKLLSKSSEMDSIVLACTHFPLIADSLKSISNNIRFWIDSSEAVARRALDLLGIEPESELTQPSHCTEIYLSTNHLNDIEVDRVQKNYLGFLQQAVNEG